MYRVTKTYGHERGLSACFRQWRAAHSHCSLLHGYALAVELVFESPTLDHRNWVVDFGGLDWIKAYLEGMFDHTTLVAIDDPQIAQFHILNNHQVIDIRVVSAVGCEAFAEMIYKHVAGKLRNMAPATATGLRLVSVEVREHGSNSATYIGDNA